MKWNGDGVRSAGFRWQKKKLSKEKLAKKQG
jgi:hypothetical protein